MLFWIYMLVIIVILPCLMILLGQYFRRTPARDIHRLLSYRTKRSMQNDDTWQTAHRYLGRLWLVGGWILLIISLLVMLPAGSSDAKTIGLLAVVLLCAQVIILMGTILATELNLIRTFNKRGERQK